MIELIRFLHQEHWAVVLYGSFLTILAAFGNRKFNTVLLPFYLVFIALMTLLYREIGAGRMNLTLFWSYTSFLRSHSLRMEIVNNIWLFVPLGAILFKLVPKWCVVFISVLVSAVVEIAQYAFDVGLCELDDMVSNGLGGLIGMAVCWGIVSIWKHYRA